MRDVIQKIIVTETEARQRVQAARAEAERILSEARAHAQEIVEAARQSARLEADEVLTEALRNAETEKKRRLARVAAEIEAQIHIDDATARQMTDAVARCVRGSSSTTQSATG